nr:N-acetylmuramoyl-L-alanine amidase [Chthonobacter rhizosphaerae]
MSFLVKSHVLQFAGQPVPFDRSPNRGGALKPLYLIIHYTAGTTASGAVSWLTNPEAKASAHIVLDPAGAATQLVEFNKVAWHAGRSSWQGIEGLNGSSIGIEIVNAGRLTKKADGTWQTSTGKPVPASDVVIARHKNETGEAGWHEYTAAQIDQTVAIGQALHAAYGFLDVLGHDDISPGRKSDPGPAFPLDAVRTRILGRA